MSCGHPVYDVVFSHTVLEHIFEIDVAFENLCKLTSDVAIVVVPFLQEQHADYGDYWRFTPQAIDRLFGKNGLKTLYVSANSHADASIYVFAIASRWPEKWRELGEAEGNMLGEIYQSSGMIGTGVIKNGKVKGFLSAIRRAVW